MSLKTFGASTFRAITFACQTLAGRWWATEGPYDVAAGQNYLAGAVGGQLNG